MKNSCNPGFYKLCRGRGVKKVSDTFTRQTRKIEQPNIYDRQTRPLPHIFQRTTRAIKKAPSIFYRLTRKIQQPADVFQRPTRKIQQPADVFQRTTRRIGPNNLISTAVERQRLAALNSEKQCSVVLHKLPDSDWRDVAKWRKFDVRVIDRSIQNHKQILYNDRHVLRGPIPLNRDTYYDLYESNKQFAVDAFNTGINVQHYFLTRFHPDQYAGLAEKFPRYIYTSEITAYLVRKILKVDGSLLRILNPDVPVIVEGVEITPINVSSYPGALMLIFKSTNGRCELHGGYMYTSAELEEVSAMWNNAQVDAVIIYNNPSILTDPDARWDETTYREEMTTIIGDFLETQTRKGLRGLLIFNSHKHMYSMEKLFAYFAHSYGLSIWADDASRHLIDGLEIMDINITEMLAIDPKKAGIHFLSDEKFETDSLLDYLGQMDAYHMLAFRVCLDETVSVSFKRPCYNKYPLTVYNIPNAYRSNSEEYQRFVKYIGLVEPSAEIRSASDATTIEIV